MMTDIWNGDLPQDERAIACFSETLAEGIQSDTGFAAQTQTIDRLIEIKKNDPPEFIRCEQVLKSYKLIGSIRREIKKRENGLREVGEDDSPKIVELMEGAPVSDDAIMPDGWEARKHAAPGQIKLIRKLVRSTGDEVKEQRIAVAHEHVVIKGIERDTNTGSTSLQLAWSHRGKWKEQRLPRDKLATPRATAEALAGSGFPVHANNAKEIVQYLIDYEATNIESLPERNTSEQMGWSKGGFLAGSEYISPDGAEPVSFRAADSGENHLAKSIKNQGSFDEWRRAASIAMGYEEASVAVYAALATPLLEVIGCPNFALEWAFRTSSGKTTALSLAASCWGNPDINASDTPIGSWDMTAVGFERRAAAMSGLPLLVDDTKRAKEAYGKSIVPSVIYAIANGQGRARGSIKGLQVQKQWRTILITTGEQRAIDFDKSGGTAARVLSMWCPPFGPSSTQTSDDIATIRNLLRRNYGFAGPAFVRWILSNGDRADGWRHQHDEKRIDIGHALSTRGVDHAVADRLAQAIALISLTAGLVHEALGFDSNPSRRVEGMLVELVADGAKSTDRATEALGELGSYISGRMHEMENSSQANENKPPSGGWLGYVPDESATQRWDWLAVHVQRLRDILSRSGHEPLATLRQWKESGALDCDGDRADKKTMTPSGRVRMVRIKREALQRVGFFE